MPRNDYTKLQMVKPQLHFCSSLFKQIVVNFLHIYNLYKNHIINKVLL